MRLPNAFLLAGALLVSGCSSLFVEQPKGPWAILKHEYRQCLTDLGNDSELRSIADKVTLDSYYDRDSYFDLLGIEKKPTAKEKVVIKKWATKLEHCNKIRADSFAYEPAGVAMWSAAADKEQLALVQELSRGNMAYGDFAARRLEIDTKYRGEIVRAIAAEYKNHNSSAPLNNSSSPGSQSNSSCGWEGNQWICRSL
ncbi:MAG: hypothetical protein Q7U91_15935 [Sideroxyarcus sp.]|nr:hypothetical protein [Sideroxyarcus sp.]